VTDPERSKQQARANHNADYFAVVVALVLVVVVSTLRGGLSRPAAIGLTVVAYAGFWFWFRRRNPRRPRE
jgi:hypothetical protein